MRNELQLLLFKQASLIEIKETSDDFCLDCDCLLDLLYDEAGNTEYLCDNCGFTVLHAPRVISSDMDITK